MNENYRDEARVEHMQRAIKKIRHHLAKVGAGSFVEGNDNAELILYHLVLLGEAANNVTAEYCAAHPSVDFRDMAGLRHKLVHDYANIDLGRIWTILQTDFPVWEESVGELAATIKPVTTLPPNVADFD